MVRTDGRTDRRTDGRSDTEGYNIIPRHTLVAGYKKVKKKRFFFLLFLIGKNRHGIGKKGGYFRLGIGPKFGP